VGEDAEEVVLELVEARVVALGVEEREARVEEEGVEELPADVLEDEHAGGERPGGLAVARALDAGAEAERPAGDVLPLHAEALARLVRQARQDGPRRAGELGARLARLGAALRVERDPRARAVLHEEERLVAARRPRDVEAHPREA